ncbi:MAG TPA: DEAD/DEAH box helicase, partial [Chloroflexota bacterium]
MMRSTTLDETRPETRGPLAAVVEHLTRHARARGLVRRLSEARHPVPLPGAARPLALALLHVVEERPLLVVTSRATRARRLQQEIAAWSPAPDRVLLFPEHDPLPYERLAGNPEHLVERLQALQALALGRRSPLVVVASARALMDRLMAPDAFRRSLQVLRVGQRVAPTRLIEDWLVRGYQLVPLVEEPGQCSRRGGIVDIYPPGATPYRLEFFGDEIDSIRPFDPATQRSTAHVPEVLVGPASEVLVAPTTAAVEDLRRLDLDGLSDPYRQATAQEIAQVAAGQSFPMLLRYRGYLGEHSLLDYLPDGGLVVLDDEHDVALQVRHLEQQAEEIRRDLERQRELPVGFRRPYWEWSEVAASLARRPCLRLAAGDDEDTSPFRPAPFFAGKLRDALRLCQEERLGGRRVIVVTQQAPRVAELFEELGESVTAAERLASPLEPLALVHASLGEGFASPELELLVLTDRELFGWTKTPRSTRPRTFGDRSALLSDLQPGDLVVHVDHGIGRYAGLVRLGDGASEREYLLVEYAEGDRLYVPVEQSDRLTRYFGGGEQQPTLTRLRGGEWEQTKRRVRRATRELARDLLSLYAAREVAVGHAFSADTPWQHELEGSFPYVETPDQLRVLAEVKADMERPRPMDRVVVGDVGYGKTEIALRAAFKAVMDGKQVAVLVPTTVLAYQHYQTFRERLQAFPVRVEMLSRFRTEAEQRAVVEGLKTGAVDICIGTHRLLQNDVGFRDLGLVIIDEEQRFGVAHKERLKQMRREV